MRLHLRRSVRWNRFQWLQQQLLTWKDLTEFYGNTCCELVKDATALEAAPDVFQCDTCPVRTWQDGWSGEPENYRAWVLYRQVVTRFGADTQTLHMALQRITADWPDEDFVDAWQRLALIYDVLQPPKKD